MGTLLIIALAIFIIYMIAKASSGSAPSTRESRPVERRPRTRSPVAPETRAHIELGTRKARVSVPATASWAPPSVVDAVREGERCWTAPGKGVEITGRTINGGMIYVGEGLRSLRGYSADPALINPRLEVARSESDVNGAQMGYWPSYSDIPPASRAAYLDWLASGRRVPGAYIGYVFLFFYGLERRVLFDAKHSASAAGEVAEILREVRELLRVYGDNGSFRGYATAFLDIAEITGGRTDGRPPGERVSWDVPLSVKRAIGSLVVAGRPIPAEWAFAWLCNHPEIQLRTPAERCPEEFAQLFQARYMEAFGDGLTLKPNKTRVAVDYRHASASFAGGERVQFDLPDVTRLTGPSKRLAKLADTVQTELDAYSRWVGRNEDRTSPAALALLPAELIRARLGAETRQLVDRLEQVIAGNDTAVADTADLVGLWPAKQAGKLNKQEATLLADLLERLGYGVEPDVRFGGANLSRAEQVVVFRAQGGPAENTDSLASAGALLHLGAALATADDEVTEAEERQLEAHLEQGLRLGEAGRVRLRARMRWLLACPPSVSSIRKSLADLPEVERHRMGRVLLALAGADGHVSSAELKLLGKIYPMLGLDPDALFADVHEMAASGSPDPVTVIPADDGDTDFRIRPFEAPKKSAGVDLDLARVAAIRAETGEVGRVLSAIFAGDDVLVEAAEPVQSVHEDESASAAAIGDTVTGIDVIYATLVRALSERACWPRVEFDVLVESHGFMPAGAIEIINEAAFAACDEPMLEGVDPIDVNTYAFEEMMA
jgi:tellurite resistance protein